jgi:hypothetical protein
MVVITLAGGLRLGCAFARQYALIASTHQLPHITTRYNDSTLLADMVI